MKTVVCYPMKSLVHTFMPTECETLAVEDVSNLSSHVLLYNPQAVILFSEIFCQPVWEWLPNLKNNISNDLTKVIIPLQQDEHLIKRIVIENNLVNTYVLSASLSYREIKQQLRKILGFASRMPVSIDDKNMGRQGKIYSLTSCGNSGVTTFCINYPLLLAKRFPDKRIVVVDMNTQKPDLTWFFQLKNYQLSLYRPDLIDIEVAEQRDWSAAFKRNEDLPNLFYSSGAVNWKNYEISTLLTILKRQFDYIYIDLGNGAAESEGIQRIVNDSNYNLLFSRADPFSLAYAARFVQRWRECSVSHQLIISPFDKDEMSLRRIKELVGLSISGVIPKIKDNRMTQSLHSRSILIQEIFPPKNYIMGLHLFNEVEKGWEGAAVGK